MNDFKNMKTIIAIIAMMFFLSLIYFVLTGCTKTVKNVVEVHDTTYVATHLTDTLIQTIGIRDTVYQVRTDTIHDYKVYRDSISVRDSIFVKESGDSIYIYKEKWNTKIVLKHDTLYKAKTDTIWSSHNDTIIVYRSLEASDTLNHSIDSDKLVVKQKRNTIQWLKMFGILAIIFTGLWIWKKYKK